MRINGPALRAIRERSMMTQESLARAAELTQAALSNIENGQRDASAQTAVKLARALRVELPAILADPAEVAS